MGQNLIIADKLNSGISICNLSILKQKLWHEIWIVSSSSVLFNLNYKIFYFLDFQLVLESLGRWRCFTMTNSGLLQTLDTIFWCDECMNWCIIEYIANIYSVIIRENCHCFWGGSNHDIYTKLAQSLLIVQLQITNSQFSLQPARKRSICKPQHFIR